MDLFTLEQKNVLRNISYKVSKPIAVLLQMSGNYPTSNLKLSKLTKYGNNKLPKTTAIFNMGSAGYCPSKILGLCPFGNKCYALKPEKQYPHCKPYRMKQAKYWLTVSAEQFANEFIEMYNRKRIKPDLFRFNESGDFYTQACVDKLYKIARLIYDATGVKSYTYTHRLDLIYYNENESIAILKSEDIYCSGLNAQYKTVSAEQFKEIEQDVKAFPMWKSNRNKYFCYADCTKCKLCAFPPLNAVIYNKFH